MEKKKMNGKELTNKELEMVNGGYKDLGDVPKIEKPEESEESKNSKACEYAHMRVCTAPDKGQRFGCPTCPKNADSVLDNG